MTSRWPRWAAQAFLMASARECPMPGTSRMRSGARRGSPGSFAETGDDAVREFGADALDKPCPEVALDAVEGLRRKLGVRNDAELPAEARIVFEVAGRAQARAHGQAQQGSHRGHGLGLPGDLESHHRELAAGPGKDDALEGALEGLVLGVSRTLAGRALEKIHAPPQPPATPDLLFYHVRALRQGEGSRFTFPRIASFTFNFRPMSLPARPRSLCSKSEATGARRGTMGTAQMSSSPPGSSLRRESVL
jgi:hypothetical protein